MNIIGRITKDAVVAQLKEEREVVNFSIAINDYYKTKSGEAKEFTTYVNCSYWLNTKVAGRLKKGALVELSGRISISAYLNMDGKAMASLNFHVNNFKVHATGKTAAPPAASEPVGITAPVDDLPF
jgi:single-strand DNA-binding protein